jgi:anti-sigma B factor antagonist
MTVSTDQQEAALVVATSVEALDASNATEFKSVMGRMIQPGARLVLDMSGIRFVDSSGLGAILSCLRQLHDQGGELKLCNMNKPVRALFELVRMHRVFEIFNTRDEAVRSYAI